MFKDVHLCQVELFFFFFFLGPSFALQMLLNVILEDAWCRRQ